MFRKGCKALGNTLVTFTNENNGCLQINSWLGMRNLWHGSKIDMSLAPKRKICVLGEKRSVKCSSGSLTEVLSNVRTVCQKRENGREGRMEHEIAGFCMQERKLALWMCVVMMGRKCLFL
ncbi:hypothetical protein Pyn_27415 [Prunus yedoensis var. nudiflora]|uniref:Uncharacterized protein n=1 Tax=Prunus yedoensis var. nudiflora TaxID=2094558 RepID=A0A314XYX9_PRUYE|nr:hypothetical protein Pyn_27415 [Prunus yedoensis var. nudiflora]